MSSSSTGFWQWMWTRTHVGAQGRRVIAIDGKTVRGARDHQQPDSLAPHLVSAYDHHTGTVLGQLAVAAKSNEIPAVRLLLKGFDLDGVVVTVDAMHTQTVPPSSSPTPAGTTCSRSKPTPQRYWRRARSCPGSTYLHTPRFRSVEVDGSGAPFVGSSHTQFSQRVFAAEENRPRQCGAGDGLVKWFVMPEPQD